MTYTADQQNIPKIGLELEGCITTCKKVGMRGALPGRLEDHLKSKFAEHELSFEFYDYKALTYNRLEMKSEPTPDVLNAVMSLSERIEEVQYQMAQFYRSQHAVRQSTPLLERTADTLNYRLMFSGMPPDGNLNSGDGYVSGLHIHAEVPEAERKAVAQKLIPYVPVLAGLTLSSPFGNDMAEDYSMRLEYFSSGSMRLSDYEDYKAFRTHHMKETYGGRSIPRPDTLEFTMCDSTSDPRAIGAVAALYQALVMKARTGDMHVQEGTWQDSCKSLKQLAGSGYEEPFRWRGGKAMFEDMVQDVYQEVLPQLEACQSEKLAAYAHYIAKGHTCAHRQKACHQAYMQKRGPKLDEHYMPEQSAHDRDVFYKQDQEKIAPYAAHYVERDLAWRGLRFSREARAMFHEHEGLEHDTPERG